MVGSGRRDGRRPDGTALDEELTFDESTSSGREEESAAKAFVARVLAARWVEALMMAVTLYALFGDDVRLLAFRRPADGVFFGLSAASFALFSAEILLSAFAHGRRYVGGFYFWLDLVATLSLIPDIGWIWDPLVGAMGGSGSSSALEAGQASRAGTRAGRIVRIVRLVRLVRIAKLFNLFSSSSSSSPKSGRVRASRKAEREEKPSQIGRKMSDLTTQRVVVLVLVLVVALPPLDGSLDTDANDMQIEGLRLLHRMPQDANVSAAAFRESVQTYVRGSGAPLRIAICHTGCAHTWANETIRAWMEATRYPDGQGSFVEGESPDGYRPAGSWLAESAIESDFRGSEVAVVELERCYEGGQAVAGSSACKSMAVFDSRAQTTQEAGLSMVKTLVIMIVLALGSVIFVRDASELVIGPIERMVVTVDALAKNPLAQFDRDDEDDDDGDGDDNDSSRGAKRKAAAASYETSLLESTLRKVGALLQVGFGEAGAEIISKNMGTDGELQPLIKGRKMYAIFGFCDIRQFTDATECLQEDVMVFVNLIGEIVHSAVHRFHGAANKNIGDAFLVVWRMPVPPPREVTATAAGRRATQYSGAPSSIYETDPDPRLVRLTDSALAAFLKTMVDIEFSNREGVLAAYADREDIQARFADSFKVRMGYGLHAGWAIEGAIGSRYKIDASYLSPHVNMASRLEAATKQYGTPLLLSGSFYALLSPAARRRCRRLDRVTVKGSKAPMELFTFDVTSFPRGFADRPATRVHFAVDPKVGALQADLPAEFAKEFEAACSRYLDGQWDRARQHLENAEQLRPGDGPSRTLRRVMGETDFVAPADWPGYRELTEK